MALEQLAYSTTSTLFIIHEALINQLPVRQSCGGTSSIWTEAYKRITEHRVCSLFNVICHLTIRARQLSSEYFFINSCRTCIWQCQASIQDSELPFTINFLIFIVIMVKVKYRITLMRLYMLSCYSFPCMISGLGLVELLI